MADALTQRQRDILDFISASIVERGFPPTLREIGEHFSIRSTNGVNDHLKALEKKGHLRREDLKSRAMRPVLPDGSGEVVPLRRAPMGTGTMNAPLRDGVQLVSDSDDDMAEIPILGRVAAGQPILAIEHATDTVRVDRVLIGGHREVFGLRIVGESMIEDGIFDGDYVFVKKTAVAKTGEIVVAMIEGEATVKRYYPEGDRIRFQPANSNMDPIIVLKSDFKSVDIIGIVVGIYRKL
ncbi:MAG: transcriptional repressor LexA [Deltaproteobacteria bacterium]|nr:transcriptional repressor LexA [Deltaproteobacteria bacterium]MDQ3301665.1 transcriptional repressor LexA [Myxococcota bacterium]